MKMCPHCKIDIEGTTQYCPLCQNELTGEASEDKWPYAFKLKKQSILYKIQLFIFLSVAIIALTLDFSFDLYKGVHWSLPVVGFVIAIQLVIRRMFRTWYIFSRLVTVVAVYSSIALMATFLYIGHFGICIYVIIPIIWTIALALNLLFLLIDKSGNAMVYLLIVFCVNIVLYWVVFGVSRITHVAWSVCLTATSICLLATIIFKGKGMLSEIQKRLSM